MNKIAGKWFTEMSDAMKSGILNHYGHMPEPEADYWNLPNGPAWGWWILSILPLDSQLQVNNEAFYILVELRSVPLVLSSILN